MKKNWAIKSFKKSNSTLVHLDWRLVDKPHTLTLECDDEKMVKKWTEMRRNGKKQANPFQCRGTPKTQSSEQTKSSWRQVWEEGEDEKKAAGLQRDSRLTKRGGTGGEEEEEKIE